MWLDLPLSTLAVVWLGGFLGGIATGAAGFAYGVVATAIWLHVLAPVHVAMLVVSVGLIIQAGLTWKMRRSLDVRRLAPFLIAGLAGVPIGVWLVIKTDPSAIKIALAAFMVVYGVYALAAPRLPYLIGGGIPADATVGFLGGILGGLSGLSGILPAIWTQIRGWPKDVARGIFQPFIVAMHLATIVLIGVVAMDHTGAVLFVAVFPAVLVGAWVGWMIYGKLDERSFQKMFAGLLVVSGLLLMT